MIVVDGGGAATNVAIYAGRCKGARWRLCIMAKFSGKLMYTRKRTTERGEIHHLKKHLLLYQTDCDTRTLTLTDRETYLRAIRPHTADDDDDDDVDDLAVTVIFVVKVKVRRRKDFLCFCFDFESVPLPHRNG